MTPFAHVKLPTGSRQGPELWYRVELDIQISVDLAMAAEVGGERSTYLSLFVGDGAAFQMDLTPGGPTCGDPAPVGVRWSTFGLVDGHQEGVSDCDGLIELRFANFLQERSVYQGDVPVAFTLDSTSPTMIRAVTLGSASRISASRDGPPTLDVSIALDRKDDGGVELGIEMLDDGYAGTPQLTVTRVDRSGKLIEDLLVVPGEDGRFTVYLAAGSFVDDDLVLVRASSGRAIAERLFALAPQGRSVGVSGMRPFAIAGLGLGLVGLGWAQHRRRRRLPASVVSKVT